MWFKNLTLFRFQEPFELTPPALAERLGQGVFRPCLSQELLSEGWVPPLGRKSSELVHAVNDCLLFSLQVEEKVLPAAVVKELLNDKIAEIEDREQRPVRRKEKERLRDELMLDLLPRAFSRSRRTFAYIDRQQGWLIIDSASAKAIEELTTQLRETLDSLPIRPPQVASAPAAIMTDWLAKDSAPADITLEDECELKAADGSNVIRCKGQELSGEEIRTHLKAGKQVTRLGLTWNDRFSLLLSDDLLIRRLRVLDLIQEQLDDVATDSDEQLFDAQFALLSGELRAFIPRLLTLFGGEARPAQ